MPCNAQPFLATATNVSVNAIHHVHINQVHSAVPAGKPFSAGTNGKIDILNRTGKHRILQYQRHGSGAVTMKNIAGIFPIRQPDVNTIEHLPWQNLRSIIVIVDHGAKQYPLLGNKTTAGNGDGGGGAFYQNGSPFRLHMAPDDIQFTDHRLCTRNAV